MLLFYKYNPYIMYLSFSDIVDVIPICAKHLPIRLRMSYDVLDTVHRWIIAIHMHIRESVCADTPGRKTVFPEIRVRRC